MRTMIVSQAVVSTVFLIAILNSVSAKPQPSIVRERHIIHTPIKFRVIHHYNIKKVPLIIKKHIHYHKPNTEHPKPVLEEVHANHVYQEDNDDHSSQPNFHLQDSTKEYSPHTGLQHQDDKYEVHAAVFQHSDHHSNHDSQEDDYDDGQQSQEDYEESEYE